MTKQATRLAMVVAIFAATAAFAQSDSQKAFDKLKTMVGTWEGVMPDGKTSQVTYRVTSGGSALLSEISPDDAMITMGSRFHAGTAALDTSQCSLLVETLQEHR